MPGTKEESVSEDRDDEQATPTPEAKAQEREDAPKAEAKDSNEKPDEAQDSKDEPEGAKDSAEDSEEDEHNSVGSDTGSPGRDPDKPMSDTQRKYLEPLAESQGEDVRDDMTEAEAAGAIDRLQENAVHVY